MPAAAYIFAVVLPHGLNQVDRTNNVVCVVQHGELHALPHSLAPSKVDDSIEPADRAALLRIATMHQHCRPANI